MDKRIRRNELCVIGLPRCDFVFSSTRSCFIGYGFGESSLEMSILRHLLSDRGIEPVEAGGTLAPGQNACCVKICSKIITSQFCIILLNNDSREGIATPNANVNMEYGLMLGFNKYILPFQRQTERLPFNVAGLDTVKYRSENFETKAAQALDLAIAATTQDTVSPITPDQILEAFLLSQQVLVVPLNSEADRTIFEMGRPLGYNLLRTFDGMQYLYFGNFTTLRPEAVVWRIKTLQQILVARIGSIEQRIQLGIVANLGEPVASALRQFVEKLQVWVLVTSEDDKKAVTTAIANAKLSWQVRVFSMRDIESVLQSIG
jgi:hypothetical protein